MEQAHRQEERHCIARIHSREAVDGHEVLALQTRNRLKAPTGFFVDGFELGFELAATQTPSLVIHAPGLCTYLGAAAATRSLRP